MKLAQQHCKPYQDRFFSSSLLTESYDHHYVWTGRQEAGFCSNYMVREHLLQSLSKLPRFQRWDPDLLQQYSLQLQGQLSQLMQLHARSTALLSKTSLLGGAIAVGTVPMQMKYEGGGQDCCVDPDLIRTQINQWP